MPHRFPTPPPDPDRPDSEPTGIPGQPAPEDPVKEIAYLIRLAYPWMSPVAARNRAVMLRNSLELDAMNFPACEQ